ncbi:hypothetical protein [Paludisphaera borealis]|uniref:Fatty acid desaturase domain-containing protein n=1 Tax=Paludisphaera borealis TaxID=1387353 RepID=A0A1U7CS01_9BACT|nr:hypothetical protein [Paludisphaera borealis]APW61715.1 hypothetical protein BSF38_03242 [Paludisphaera borealis]
MNTWIQIAVGLTTSYLIATLSESYMHRAIGHAGARTRRNWARHPRLCGFLTRAHYRHAVVHHGLTYARDHVTQFLDESDKARVDAILKPRGDWLIEKERYGLTIHLRGVLTFNAIALPMPPVLFWLCGPIACLSALPVPIAVPLLSMFIHPYLHLPHEDAVRLAPRPLAVLLRTRYCRALARHHYVHHVYQRFNFNLLMGGDWLLGTYRQASPDDLLAMEAIGIPTHESRQAPPAC